jgi:hypothetical protein
MHPAGPTGRKEKSEGPWQKWGVVIAFGALLLAYIGTASQVHWVPFSRSSQITLPSPVPSPTSTLPGHASTPPTTTHGPTASPTVAVRYQGPVTIGAGGIELDTLPPTTNGSTDTVLYGDGFLEAAAGTSSTIAGWTRSPNPTYSQCKALVVPNGVTSLQVTPGMDVCVLTESGRMAYLKNVTVSADGQTVSAEVTVWNQ